MRLVREDLPLILSCVRQEIVQVASQIIWDWCFKAGVNMHVILLHAAIAGLQLTRHTISTHHHYCPSCHALQDKLLDVSPGTCRGSFFSKLA